MFDRISLNTPAGNNMLQFWKLSGMEVVSRSFDLSVSALSTDAQLDRKAMLGQPITLTIPTEGLVAAPRYLNGKITAVNVQSVELNGSDYTVYTLRMESDLWPLLRDRNQRIFQNQRVPDIIKTVLSEFGVHVEDKLASDYRSWEYCVQYQESSFDFISRLMELEGIYFFFRHDADQHTLVLADAPSAHQPFSGYETIPYHTSASGGSTIREGIGKWAISERVTPGLYSIDDYDFRKPNAWMLQARQNPASPSPGQIDYYEWPGRFVDHSHGDFYARIRQEEWQAEHQRIDAVATAIGIVPGCTFTLLNPPYVSDIGEYLVLSAAYELEENSYASGGNDSVHSIKFVVIPANVNFRSAQRTAWPRTHGPQTARVVGPQGQSIWTDKYGRVKVKFHWDRLAKGDDTSSCWIRVSSAWAGQGFGGVQIPRVNDEVVIDFINGDPDRPIITGRVYNDAKMPPWSLPAAATQMGFLSRSKDGNPDNANALRFEDKAGHEQVWIHAEKNMDTEVENNQTLEVGVDRTKTIGRDEKQTIKRNQQVNVGVNATHNTGSKHTINVGEKTVEAMLTMDKDGNALLEANTSIKLKVKNNYILITPDAIEIQVVDGNLTAQAAETALFKGINLTTLGGGVDATLSATDSVAITGNNVTDIKGAVVKVNS